MTELRRWTRLVLVGGGLSYRALFNWTRPALYVPTLLVSPILGTIFFAYLGRSASLRNDEFYVLGNGVLAVAGPCVFGGVMALANERRYQTLPAVLGTPAPRGAILLGRALPYVGNGLLVSVVVTTCASLLLRVHLPAAAVPGLVLTGLLAAASCSAFGLALGAIGLRLRDVWVISNTVWVGLWLVSGANVPRADLPDALSAIGAALPLAHAIDAARQLAAGALFADALPALGWESLVGLGWAAAAATLVRVFERAGRRHASLDIG